MKAVSCIIPAYNEGSRIANVLKVVAHHPLLAETIVVDDGSTDNTRDIIADQPGVTLIPLAKNGGKSAAVVEGIRKSSGELVLLIDADLSGLTHEYITKIIEPIAKGEADVAISLRGNTPLPWRLIGLDYISGERVFAKTFIDPLLADISSLQGFGLEAFMNRHIVRQRLRIAVVSWPNVASALKHAGTQAWWYFGIKKDYIRMAFLVMRTISPFEMAWQIARMLSLRTLY